MSALPDTYDVVIVGAGSAGYVLPNRLSADPKISVLLSEAGGNSRHPFVRMPAGFRETIHHPRFTWGFKTAAGDGVPGRAIYFPRDKLLGGSSSINGHLYVRGQQTHDSDTWAQRGNAGWSYADVPYFRCAEDRFSGADDFNGVGGPKHVSDIHERHPLCEAFIAGAAAIGVPVNPDYNGASQEGVAYYQCTIRSGHRHSPAPGYLAPARRRANLTVVTHAAVIGLDPDGRQSVCGIGGAERSANREMVVATGAIGSPHLLQVARIGDPAHLADLGVSVRHALTGVGANFQDHYAVCLVNQGTRPVTLNESARGPRLLWGIGRRFVNGGGILAFIPAHVGAFLRSRDGLAAPDL